MKSIDPDQYFYEGFWSFVVHNKRKIANIWDTLEAETVWRIIVEVRTTIKRIH